MLFVNTLQEQLMANFTVDKLNDTRKLYQGSIQPWVTGIAFLAGLNIFLSVSAFLGNVLILTALHNVLSLHPPTKALFRCLAVTDLCVGISSQPLYAIEIMNEVIRINWKIAHYGHELGQTLSFVLCGLSILTSTAISVDRLLALLLGLRYRHVVTLWRVRAVIICFLLVFVSVGLINIFYSTRISFTIALVCIILSLVFSVYSYAKIFLRLRQHQGQVQGYSHQVQPNGGGIPLNIARYKKTVSSIAWVQLALIACYVPFGIVIIERLRIGISHMALMSAITLVYLNSSLNPFLYCWKITDVRQAVKNTLRQFCC